MAIESGAPGRNEGKTKIKRIRLLTSQQKVDEKSVDKAVDKFVQEMAETLP